MKKDSIISYQKTAHRDKQNPTQVGDKNERDFFNQFDKYVEFNTLNVNERPSAFPLCLDSFSKKIILVTHHCLEF